MKMNTMKRVALSGLLALSMVGGALAPVMAGHAAAGSRPYLCPVKEPCPVMGAVNLSGSGVDGGLAGGVFRDGGASGGMLRDGSKPGLLSGGY